MHKNVLIFATGNQHKLDEIRNLVSEDFQIKGMHEVGFLDEIDEYGKTLEENARIKSDCIYKKFQLNCFSDDSGLEINALDGRPGVYSARFAGKNCSFDDNMDKVLNAMENVPKHERNARFRTIINLWWEDKNYSFEGIVQGRIEFGKRGEFGFGYDPIFTPSGESRTFAEMTQNEKSKHSHRAIAMKKLIAFLNEQITD